MESKVLIFRLITGEDLISEHERVTDGRIRLIKPMKILYMMSQEGISISLVQWVFPVVTEMREYIFDTTNILTRIEPTKALQLHYGESTKHFDKINSSIKEEADKELYADIMLKDDIEDSATANLVNDFFNKPLKD